MSDDRAFDRAVRDWGAAGSDRTPPAAIDAVLLAIKTTPQERDLRIPWRSPRMSQPLRLAAAVAIVAVVVVGTAYVFRPGPQIGNQPSSSPSSTPTSTALVDFTSTRYGYSVRYPESLTSTPATEDWVYPGPVLTTTAGIDRFAIGNLGSPEAFLGLGAQFLPPTLSDIDWFDEYAVRNTAAAGAACGGTAEDWSDVSFDGHAGRRLEALCQGDPISEVIFVADGHGWVITGDTALVDVALASLVLPSGATTIVSTRFGYSLDLPPGWRYRAATTDWPANVYPVAGATYTDNFERPPGAFPTIDISTQVLPEGQTEAEFLAFMDAGTAAICTIEATEEVTLDSTMGRFQVQTCGYRAFEVVVFDGSRAYLIYWLGETDSSSIDRDQFETVLATFRFGP